MFDNVYAALYKLFLTHSAKFGDEISDKMMTYLIEKLPLMNDKEESCTVNRYLVLGYESNNMFLKGNE